MDYYIRKSCRSMDTLCFLGEGKDRLGKNEDKKGKKKSKKEKQEQATAATGRMSKLVVSGQKGERKPDTLVMDDCRPFKLSLLFLLLPLLLLLLFLLLLPLIFVH